MMKNFPTKIKKIKKKLPTDVTISFLHRLTFEKRFHSDD